MKSPDNHTAVLQSLENKQLFKPQPTEHHKWAERKHRQFQDNWGLFATEGDDDDHQSRATQIKNKSQHKNGSDKNGMDTQKEEHNSNTGKSVRKKTV